MEPDLDDTEFNGNNDDETRKVKNAFIDHKGLIEVKIHLGNKTVEPDEELSFEIVFTAFQGTLSKFNYFCFLL